MKALTFLGTSKYESVTYVWRDEEKGELHCETRFSPVAIAKIFEPEKVLVFVTPQAKAHQNYHDLTQELGELLKPIDIREGKSEAELWQIFDKVAESVKEGETVLLDITHAFRSIPLVVFSVAAYLRRTKSVKIEHIVYGAFEARDQTNRAPIFDLTPLLDLLDWLSGAEFFLRRSDATLLGERLQSVHQQAWQTKNGESLPRRLQNIGNQLISFSQAMHLARPREVMWWANRLQETVEEAVSEFEQWARPFTVILNQVRSEVGKLAYDAPERLDKENLQKQLALIRHFVEKGLLMQAVTLAREWMVTWVAFRLGKDGWLKRDCREEIENALGEAASYFKKPKKEPFICPDLLNELSQCEEIAQLWNWLGDLRNDVAHCGMREGAARIKRIQERATEIPQRLESLMNGLPDHVLYGTRVVIDLKDLYGEVAKLDKLPDYLEQAKELAGEGNEVVLTGQAPVWLYLAVAHALHGRAQRLYYHSPVTGEMLIFDHSAR